uniref:protein S100-A9-like n=1 Tax=Jaculus jaculus TaxID=51337 RepID=UPI001E1AFF7A|nr:protein S100-A9-like [Jaculus jaculus]
MAQQQTALEESIENIVNIFHQYSVRIEPRDLLNKKELRNLVANELPNFLKKETRNQTALDDLMEDLDKNQDSQLDFNEFVVLVSRVLQARQQQTLHP